MQKRPLTAAHVGTTLAKVARLPDGRMRAVVVPWIPGNILGGFDMLDVRSDDPTDVRPPADFAPDLARHTSQGGIVWVFGF